MGDNARVWMPDAASTIAPEIDSLFYFVIWTSTIIFVGVIGAMLYFTFRYRRTAETHTPNPLPEHRLMEALWILTPLVLVMIVFTWGFKAYLRLNIAPKDSYQIQVLGKQWLWEFTYPNGVESAGELHVPVDRPVKLTMSSADVLHSFFVPAFRIKYDVLPNRYTSVWFQATKTGEFRIFCTEYCGTQHSAMLGKVVVHTETEFQEWLQTSGVGDMTPVEYGEVVFNQQNCVVCHSVDGSARVGPSLLRAFGKTESFEDGSSAVVDENYLRESILQPGARIVSGYPNAMPATYSTLRAEQVDALIAYIKSLE